MASCCLLNDACQKGFGLRLRPKILGSCSLWENFSPKKRLAIFNWSIVSCGDGSVCERFFAPGKSLIHYIFIVLLPTPLRIFQRVFKAPLTFFITTHYWCQIHIQTSHFMWKRLSHYASGWLKTTKNSCNYWRCQIPCCAHYHWIDKINIWFC